MNQNRNKNRNWKKGAGMAAAAAMLTAALTMGSLTGAQAAGTGLGTAISMRAAAVQQSISIGVSAAKTIALADAGVEEKNAVFTKAKQEKSGNILIYEVKFTSGGWSYEYEIQASNGKILKSGKEAVKDTASGTGTQTKVIGLKAAKAVALADAGVAEKDASFTKTKRKLEDGRYVYELKFTAGDKKYEYEIRASDGVILESDQKQVKKDSDSGKKDQTSKYIGVAAAKEIALKDAGVQAKDAVFLKAKRERSNKRYHYDVEFTAGGIKYEYEIRATDGYILEQESEKVEEDRTDSKYIGVTAAKQAALKHAGVSSSNAVFKKAKLDRDDGVWMYEIEFVSGHMEYEYEIDAKTGTILDYDSEWDD